MEEIPDALKAEIDSADSFVSKALRVINYLPAGQTFTSARIRRVLIQAGVPDEPQRWSVIMKLALRRKLIRRLDGEFRRSTIPESRRRRLQVWEKFVNPVR